MIIAIVLLAALLIVYFALSGGEDVPETILGTTDENIIMLAENDHSKILTLSYKCGETDISFEKKDGSWQLEDDEKFPLDESKVTDMAIAIANIGAHRHVVNLAAASDRDELIREYGFDEPFCTITVGYDDDREYKYILGAYNSFNGSYYFREDGSDDIYMVVSALYDYFDYEINDLILLDTFPSIDSGTVNAFRLTTPEYTKETEDFDEVSALYDLFDGTELSDWVEYGAEEETFAEYGLNKEKRIAFTALITSSDSESKVDGALKTEETEGEIEYDDTFSVYFGSLTEDGESVYMTIDDSTIVYKVKKAHMDAVTDIFLNGLSEDEE